MKTVQMYASLNGNPFSDVKVPKIDLDYKPITGGSAGSTGGSATGGDWWQRNGATITGLASTIAQLGLTATQIALAFKKGDASAINSQGQKVDLSGLKQQLEAQAQRNNERFEDRFNKLLDYVQKTQAQAQPQQTKKDNTLLYVGVGVLGVAVLGVGLYFIATNKKRK